MSFTCLGLPLGSTKPTVMELMPFVDRIERSMSATFMVMTYNGKVRAINSLLSSIDIFVMCSLSIPPKILENIKTTLLMEQENRGRGEV
jgi:hypothetical protein